MPQTLDDKLAEKQKKEQDEFSDAFDEIEGKDPELHKALHGDEEHLAKDAPKGDSLKKDATDVKPEADADDAVAKDADDVQLDNTDSGVNPDLFTGLKKESATDGQAADAKDIQISELQAQLHAEQNKTSSWDGRIKAANKRADEAEAKNKEFEERLKALESGTDAVDKPAAGDKAADIKKFFDDYPEFEAPIKALIAKGITGQTGGVTMDEVKAEILPEVEKANALSEEQVNQNKYMSDLQEYHSDVVSLINSGKITEWIDKQPAYIARELTRVYQGGTVEEAKTLIDEFKRTSGYTTSNNSEHNDSEKDDKLKSMLEVDSDSAGPPAGEPDKNNFDEAADEAFKDE